MGTVNLFVGRRAARGRRALDLRRHHGALHPAAIPWRPAAGGPRHTFGLVLLGDLIYLVVVLCIEDPVRYATPLMLLFPAFVAAWFLGPWDSASTWCVTTVVCLVALWPSYDNAVGLGVQVGVSAGMLNAGALGVFVLRRRCSGCSWPPRR